MDLFSAVPDSLPHGLQPISFRPDRIFFLHLFPSSKSPLRFIPRHRDTPVEASAFLCFVVRNRPGLSTSARPRGRRKTLNVHGLTFTGEDRAEDFFKESFEMIKGATRSRARLSPFSLEPAIWIGPEGYASFSIIVLIASSKEAGIMNSRPLPSGSWKKSCFMPRPAFGFSQ